MHEFSIAWEIWQSVTRAVQQHGASRVRAIAVEIGDLNLIEDEQLSFWVCSLAERDGSPGVELVIHHVPGSVRCRRCGDESSRPTTARPACSQCGSCDTEVTGGREIRVVSAEVDGGNDEPDGCPAAGPRADSEANPSQAAGAC